MTLSQQIIIQYQKPQEGTWKKVPFCKVECYWQIGQLLFLEYWKIIHQPDTLKEALEKLRQTDAALPSVQKLQRMVDFYLAFPNKLQLSPLLTWSHYQALSKVKKLESRNYYHQEAIQERWTLVQLQKAIVNQQYERSQPLLKNNALSVAAHSKTYFQFGFLEQFRGKSVPERVLEDALIEQLQAFLGELGKGFAFVARQKRLITPNGKQMFIDLLFYNYLLKRFVLIDLKVVPLNYEHIGQMDTYCRLFNETNPVPEANPCLGIILCPAVDTSLLHYSLLKNNPTIFAFEYTLDQVSPKYHKKRQAQKQWEEGLFGI